MALRYLCALFVLGLSVTSLTALTDLRTRYPFSAVLLNDASQGYYAVHWNFTLQEKRIDFAVNVSTKGWIGFGLSPNGGMVGSDVVIGWINNGVPYFQDRYADAQAIPPADSNQDWCLTKAEEIGEHTILEFNRKFVTCDDRDLDVSVDTARVIWSFNPTDPKDDNDANLLRHTQRGALSVNLLGGNPVQRPVGNEPFLDITVTNVTIPSGRTTYWCESYQLPTDVVNTTHFVNRVSPSISPHVREFVHHILVYLCPVALTPAEVGVSRPCDETTNNVRICLGRGVLVGAWAVGGDEYAYPEGIAFAVGGRGTEHFAVMQMHYDNPNLRSGVVDSSGLRFYYTTAEPQFRAGVMYLGLDVSMEMIIPPKSREYTVTAVCSTNCTSEHFPEEGITIIGNLLHTHLAGRSVTISHYRRDTTTNQLVELEPLDQNLNYDFNFQQFTHLSSPRVVKRGDTLVMKCTYDTTDRNVVTYGGESTLEEMCLSFPIFYPRAADGSSLISCSSAADLSSSLTEFGTYVIIKNLTTVDSLQNNFFPTLEGFDWAGDPMLATSLQNSLSNGNIRETCTRENINSRQYNVPIPSPDVPYVAPNVCSGVPKGELSPTCLNVNKDSGTPPVISASLLLVSLAAMVLCMTIM